MAKTRRRFDPANYIPNQTDFQQNVFFNDKVLKTLVRGEGESAKNRKHFAKNRANK